MKKFLHILTLVGSVLALSTPAYAQSVVGGVVTVSVPDVQSSGTIALATPNATYTITPANGASTASFSVTGLTGSSAVLIAEGTNDGTNWVTISGVTAGSNTPASVLSADTQFRLNASARRGIRLRVSVAGTGTATVASTMSIAGYDPRSASLDSVGGILPAQAVYLDSQAVALVANAAAVQIDSDVDTGTTWTAMTTAQRTARKFFTVQTASATTAPVFVCVGGQAANCSAAHYTFRIAAAAGDGAYLIPPFASIQPIYAFSTAAVTLKVSNQIAQ